MQQKIIQWRESHVGENRGYTLSGDSPTGSFIVPDALGAKVKAPQQHPYENYAEYRQKREKRLFHNVIFFPTDGCSSEQWANRDNYLAVLGLSGQL